MYTDLFFYVSPKETFGIIMFLIVSRVQRVVVRGRRIVVVSIAIMRLIRAPQEMIVRPERAGTAAQSATAETRETTVSTVTRATLRRRGSPAQQRPETDPAESHWRGERETGNVSGSVRERGIEKERGTTPTERKKRLHKKRGVTEEDMAERRAGGRTGMSKGPEEGEEERQTSLTKVRK